MDPRPPEATPAATLLAQQGREVVLLEKALTPGFGIGESLMPETYWILQLRRAVPGAFLPAVDLLVGDVFKPQASDLFADMATMCDFSAGVLEEV